MAWFLDGCLFHVYMMLDSKIQKIQSYKYIYVLRGLNITGPTV